MGYRVQGKDVEGKRNVMRRVQRMTYKICIVEHGEWKMDKRERSMENSVRTTEYGE